MLVTFLGACSPYGPGPQELSPSAHLTLFTLHTQAGKTYYAVTLRLAGDVPYRNGRLTMRIPKETAEAVEAPPAGTRVARVWRDSVSWEVEDPGGPTVLGPFVVRAASQGGRPEWAKFSWSGGEVRTYDVLERFGGGASGYGVLRPTATTSRILIGRETEITAYAVGGGIENEIHIIALKDPIEVPPPDAVTAEEVEVAAFSAHVEPDKPYLVGMELAAPRPLPPLSRLRVTRAPLDPPDAGYEPATFAGTVSADGSRVLVPIAGSGKYRAYIDSSTYRSARAELNPAVLLFSEPMRARLAGASQASDPARRTAFLALGDSPAIELLARDSPTGPGFSASAPITDTAWRGPLLCSIEACLGSTASRPAVVCDTTYGNVGCLDVVPEEGAVGLTVGDAEKTAQACADKVCFVREKALVDKRGVEAARNDPVVFAVVAYELLSYSGDAVA